MTTPTETSGKLLVDLETGRVLRADDQLVLTRRMAETHPFIETVETWEGDVLFAGPEAGRRAGARRRNEGEKHIDAIEFEIVAQVGDDLHLQKVEAL